MTTLGSINRQDSIACMLGVRGKFFFNIRRPPMLDTLDKEDTMFVRRDNFAQYVGISSKTIYKERERRKKNPCQVPGISQEGPSIGQTPLIAPRDRLGRDTLGTHRRRVSRRHTAPRVHSAPTHPAVNRRSHEATARRL